MSISKQSLQTVLSAVEELNLPEGEYLNFCNLMKKEFEKIPDVSHEVHRDCSVVFRGKRDYTITIHTLVCYSTQRPNEIVFSINGGQKKQLNVARFYDSLQRIYIINNTSSLGIVEDGIGERFFTLQECVVELLEWNANLSGEELSDDDDSCEFFQVIKWLFCID